MAGTRSGRGVSMFRRSGRLGSAFGDSIKDAQAMQEKNKELSELAQIAANTKVMADNLGGVE